MELEEIKKIWTSYNEKLDKNIKFNEEFLVKINLDKSKKEMNTPLNYEICSIITAILVILLILKFTLNYGDNIVYLLSGILSIILCTIAFFLSFHKIKLLLHIDYFSMSVVDIQKSILKFKTTYLLYKKIEMILSPLLIITILPVLGKGIRGFDFSLYMYNYIIITIIALLISYPILILIYKNLYDKKMKHAFQLLKEIQSFEED